MLTAISTSIFLYVVSSGALDQWTLTHVSKTSVKGERKPSLSDPAILDVPDRVQLVILSVSSLFPSSVRFNGRLDRVFSSLLYAVISPYCVSLYYRVSLSTHPSWISRIFSTFETTGRKWIELQISDNRSRPSLISRSLSWWCRFSRENENTEEWNRAS